MGLPRASGSKRRWSGEDEDALPAAKVICTSPPHALCAEDVLHHPTLTHANASTPSHECEMTSGEAAISDPGSTHLEVDDDDGSGPGLGPAVFPESDVDESSDDQDDFIDDEEDKDSGFIDSNSIDNSSDEEVDARVITSDPVVSLSLPDDDIPTTTSTALQLSLSRVLPPVSNTPLPTNISGPSSDTLTATSSSVSVTIPTTNSVSPVTPPTSTLLPATLQTSSLTVTITTSSLPSTVTITASSSMPLLTQESISEKDITPGSDLSPTSPPPCVSPPPATSDFLLSVVSAVTTCTTTTTTTASSVATTNEDRGPGFPLSEGRMTTVTAAQTGTVVTSAYQGSLSSPAYDPHPFGYTSETYPMRPSSPGWESCNYYDGSQPVTNKYMEISPDKTSSSQSIQCDENGKSYLELGSASPYTHTYTNDCGSYTTSPSSYPSQSYNQTYRSTSSYGQPSNYYNSRQSYSPNPYNLYPNNENYNHFEGENGCSYSYGGGGFSGARGATARGPPRCLSPYCDPTRGSPRPSCYHQQRLSVLNMSMYKLNRFRQFPDPSLHRSVLICNTLRRIERELEAEGVSVASILAHSHAHSTHPHLQGTTPNPGSPPCPEPMPSSPLPSPPPPSEGPLPPIHAPLSGSPLAVPSSPPPSTPATLSPVTHYSTSASTVQYPSTQYLPEDHSSNYDNQESLHPRPYQSLSTNSHEEAVGDPTQVVEEEVGTEEDQPTPTSRPAPLSPEDRTDAINWCSVLSLSSQTDLDSMNNNEYGDWGGESSSAMDYSRPDDSPAWKLPSLSADDVLKSFPEASKRLEANEDLDSIINVLVGS